METNVAQLKPNKTKTRRKTAKKTKITASDVMLELRANLATTLQPYLKDSHTAPDVVSKLEAALLKLAVQKTSGFLGKYVQSLFQ